MIAVLLVAGLPFLSVNWGTADERVLQEDDPTRVLVETLDAEFASDEASAFPIVAHGDVPRSHRDRGIRDLGVAGRRHHPGRHGNGQLRRR